MLSFPILRNDNLMGSINEKKILITMLVGLFGTDLTTQNATSGHEETSAHLKPTWGQQLTIAFLGFNVTVNNS